MKTYHMCSVYTCVDGNWLDLHNSRITADLNWLRHLRVFFSFIIRTRSKKNTQRFVKVKGNTHLLMVYTHDFNMTLLSPLWLIVLWINERGGREGTWIVNILFKWCRLKFFLLLFCSDFHIDLAKHTAPWLPAAEQTGPSGDGKPDYVQIRTYSFPPRTICIFFSTSRLHTNWKVCRSTSANAREP